jgi:hypothetical protein
MKRRWRVLTCLLLFILIGVVLSVPAIHWRLIGWAKGEAFYQARPTSWWEMECQRWKRRHYEDRWDAGDIWIRDPSWIEQRFAGWLGQSAERGPFFLKGDLTALPVLIELMEKDDEHVREIGLLGTESAILQHWDDLDPPTRGIVISALQRVSTRQYRLGRMADQMLQYIADPGSRPK